MLRIDDPPLQLTKVVAVRTLGLTLAALVAFAANSILCRLALGSGAIDAGSFTALRLGSGAAVLALVARMRHAAPAGNWRSALALATYAVGFAFAYNSLAAGTGALLLFGAVQLTMIAAGVAAGERPPWLEWLGLGLALAGLLCLLAPGLHAPPLVGALSMLGAGIAWGIYSLRGRATGQAVATTAGNFLRAVAIALLCGAATLRLAHVTPRGILLAVTSGAVTSGLGYVLWYAALGGLSATRAATAQLGVPLLTALAGVLFLAERVTPRLLLSAALILGGVMLALRVRKPR
jgi:drug/metabolite transporter (DMT)-like permease